MKNRRVMNGYRLLKKASWSAYRRQGGPHSGMRSLWAGRDRCPPRRGMDLVIRFIEQGQQALEFAREPADLAIPVVPAAGLGLAVAVEEGPVGWPPILLPEAVFFQDSLPEVFGGLGLELSAGAELAGKDLAG